MVFWGKWRLDMGHIARSGEGAKIPHQYSKAEKKPILKGVSSIIAGSIAKKPAMSLKGRVSKEVPKGTKEVPLMRGGK